MQLHTVRIMLYRKTKFELLLYSGVFSWKRNLIATKYWLTTASSVLNTELNSCEEAGSEFPAIPVHVVVKSSQLVCQPALRLQSSRHHFQQSPFMSSKVHVTRSFTAHQCRDRL